MDERAALMRAVCANPDDDNPRLVFADWLQENGEEARAEFIRLQVEFAALHRGAAPGAEAVRKRERAIWAEHKDRFRAELPEIAGVAWFTEFHRGFVERCTVSGDAVLVRHADAIFTRAPVQHVEVAKFTACDGFESLAYLGRLKTLRLFSRQPDRSLVRRLAACSTFGADALILAHFGDGFSATLKGVLSRAFGERIRFYT